MIRKEREDCEITLIMGTGKKNINEQAIADSNLRGIRFGLKLIEDYIDNLNRDKNNEYY